MTPGDILQFWFADDPNLFRGDPWFRKNDAYDAICRDRFGFTLDAARDGTLDHWADTAPGALALVIVLDQFSRNIHRGCHLAFAADAHALGLARAAVDRGLDGELTPVQRVFLYLPFEHSEDPADQDISVRLFESLQGDPQLANSVKSAHRHREVIRRFGRYPHRNAALGRIGTPEEEAYNAEPGSGF